MSKQAVHVRDLQRLMVKIWREPDLLPKIEEIFRLVAEHQMTATEGVEDVEGMLGAT